MEENILKNQLFKNISEKELGNIFKCVTFIKRTYHKGEVIAHEDDECLSLGLIILGSVEIKRIYSNGKSITIQRLEEGDVFGEALCFSSQGNYPATVEAVGKTTIFFIRKEEIINLCLKEPKVLENFITLLSDKVFKLNAKIKNISFKSLNHRVINYILESSKKQGNNKIKLKVSKESIAAALGMPRPSLSRELMKLRNENLINFGRDYIEIKDFNVLEEKLFQ